ncbi:MAG: primosomal protein N' [Velocimicrobium sp.]
MIFADVIVDISHESLDKTYQYIVKPEQEESAVIGAPVVIPFGRGNRTVEGYIVGLSQTPAWDLNKTKELLSVSEKGIVIESQLIYLAYWMKETYGSTMNDALKTVIPVKKAVKNKEKKFIGLNVSREIAQENLSEFIKKKNKGRVRLLEALIENPIIESEMIKHKLNISQATITGLIERNLIYQESKIVYRNPIKNQSMEQKCVTLNLEQIKIVDGICKDYVTGKRKTYLIHGVTGSGKTEVYMEIIDTVLKEGKQVIMLIPEISLTYQTVMRFYKRFGERISILNSRMSKGERYDQYLRAKNGGIDIMIGPRSALFTPFPDLGLIIIDEEHEGSYKSETAPKYHARETSIERARLTNASVILGSATPTVESYYRAQKGEYVLYSMFNRAQEAQLPSIEIVDLREELKKKNKSIFSERLKQLIVDRLEKKEQIMLFINRRGYAGFVSCRSCGHVLKCPHCDISLTSHNNGKLVCHYCGYETSMVKLCPTCGSPYIAAFGTGTQKIEEMVKREFPFASVLRMDMDTTTGKEGHQKILEAFANHEADILVGTQMIVKGHDFKEVTLVGILAADLSLYAGNYLASERTYQLLTQAAGRAGRGEKPGNVVIQTYNPEHYSIRYAASNSYDAFYSEEILYRNMLDYPPMGHMIAILLSFESEGAVDAASKLVARVIKEKIQDTCNMKLIGPAKASVSKANDIYRRVIYLKDKEERNLKEMIHFLEGYIKYSDYLKDITIQFDYDPINTY